jgi:hypothetical protein
MENWLPIVGLEGSYEISDLGRVKTLPRTCKTKGGSIRRVLGGFLRIFSSRGYPCVTLSKDGKQKPRYIHTLILEAFVGLRPTPVHHACHFDGDPSNNVLSNLRWDTPKENYADRTRHNRCFFGTRNPKLKLTQDQAAEIFGSNENSREIAVAYGVSYSTVRDIKTGRSWAHFVGSKDAASDAG